MGKLATQAEASAIGGNLVAPTEPNKRVTKLEAIALNCNVAGVYEDNQRVDIEDLSINYSKDGFVTKWLVPTGGVISFTHDNMYVYWGDGTISQENIHMYDSSYVGQEVTIYMWGGTSFMAYGGTADALLEVLQFGNIQWSTMWRLFSTCSNMNFASDIDVPIMDNVTDMYAAFHACSVFNSPVDYWDVSNVTNMESLFNLAYKFNQPVNSWNVSNVTDMTAIFANAREFNQPLNNWDTSSNTSLYSTFYNALVFDQDLTSWDTSKVTIMSGCFNTDLEYVGLPCNVDITTWDISSVENYTGENTSMYDMFRYRVIPTNNVDLILENFWNQVDAGTANTDILLQLGNSYYSSVGEVYDASLRSVGWSIYSNGLEP